MRFHAELRAIAALPNDLPSVVDPLFASIDEAFNDLEKAANEADYEAAAKKLRHTVALVHEVAKRKATRWAKWESACSALQQGVENALEKDRQ